MALKLREIYLVCDVNTLKQQLMELETQVGFRLLFGVNLQCDVPYSVSQHVEIDL